MKYDILNRWSRAVQFTAEIECNEDAARSVKVGLAVKWAVKNAADLSDADLSDADLSDANLSDADLRATNLSAADLSDANLRAANLRAANLRAANLRAANLSDASKTIRVPKVVDIDVAIAGKIDAGCKLDMSTWHNCETTHCRAGWAVMLAGEAGLVLESLFGSNAAGALIYAESRPGQRVPNFFADDEGALADIRECAKRQEETKA